MKLELPLNIRMLPVVHVEHTLQVRRQLPKIAQAKPPVSQPLFDDKEIFIQEVEQTLAQRQQGRNFTFLTLFEGAPMHEAE